MDENNSVFESDVLDEATVSAIDAAWYDEDGTAEATETEETDQSDEAEETEAEEETEDTAENEPEDGEEETEKAEEKKADELFELKHLGETKSVTRDEMKALAQKGLDYDRIRAERDALKAEKENGNEYEQFVKELAEQQKTTPEELMMNQRVRSMMLEDRTLTAAKAREMIKAQQDERKSAKAAEAKRNESFRSFAQAHPDVKPEDIPQSVWDDVHGGMDIGVAYDKFAKAEESRKLSERNAELEKELAALKANQKNAARSTGSKAKSRGTAPKMSAFDAAWYDGT